MDYITARTLYQARNNCSSLWWTVQCFPSTRCSQQTNQIAQIISVGLEIEKPCPPLEKKIKISIPSQKVDTWINHLINFRACCSERITELLACINKTGLHSSCYTNRLTCNKENKPSSFTGARELQKPSGTTLLPATEKGTQINCREGDEREGEEEEFKSAVTWTP